MKFLVNGIVFAFVYTAVWKTQAAPSTLPPSDTDQQQQQQQQQQQVDTFTLPPSTTTTTTQATNDSNQQTETNGISSSTESSLSTTLSTTTIDSNTTDGNQLQQQQTQTSVPDTVCEGLLPASQCVNAAYQDMISSLFYFVFHQNVDNLVEDVCYKYPSHRQCVKSALTTCNGAARVRFDVGLAAFDYICSVSGRAAVKEAWPCLADPTVAQHLRICSAQVSSSSASDGPCSIASYYVQCVSSTFQQRCSSQSADAIQELLTATLSPFSNLFSCPAVNTTVPPTSTTTVEPTTTAQDPTTTTDEETTTTMMMTTAQETTTAADTTTTEETTTTEATTTTTEPTTTTTEATTTTTTESTTTTMEPTTTTTTEPTTTTTEPTTTTTEPTTTTTEPTTTTTEATTRPASIKCFDCSTNPPGLWQNPMCPSNGTLDVPKLTTPSCTSPCFTRISASPYGTVYRGCTVGWKHLFTTTPIPTSGCHTIMNNNNAETWCFCDHNNCNVHDMSAYLTIP